MFLNVLGDFVVRLKRCCQDKRQLVLTDRVARAIFDASFRSGISQTLETKNTFVEMRRLLRVADVKLNMIRAFERQKIFRSRGGRFCLRSSNCCCHKLPPLIVAHRAFPNIRSTASSRKEVDYLSRSARSFRRKALRRMKPVASP